MMLVLHLCRHDPRPPSHLLPVWGMWVDPQISPAVPRPSTSLPSPLQNRTCRRCLQDLLNRYHIVGDLFGGFAPLRLTFSQNFLRLYRCALIVPKYWEMPTSPPPKSTKGGLYGSIFFKLIQFLLLLCRLLSDLLYQYQKHYLQGLQSHGTVK